MLNALRRQAYLLASGRSEVSVDFPSPSSFIFILLFLSHYYFIIIYYRVLLFSKHIMVMRIVIKIRDDYEKDNAFDDRLTNRT